MIKTWYKLRWKLLIFIFIFALVCITLFLKNNRGINSEPVAIRAVHYFGQNSWAKNFWNAMDLSKVDSDFKEIKSNGFNAIILVVPWGEFQQTTNPIAYNYDRLKSLSKIIDIARKNNLLMILRISYYWDLDQYADPERFVLLYSDQQTYFAWLDYIKTIYGVVKNKPNFYLAFLSWEDIWQPLVQYVSRGGIDMVTLGRDIGFVDAIPPRTDAKFKLFFEYLDFLLINRFLIPAQGHFPNLSLEVRVDKDPIYEKGKIVEWYSHQKTYDLQNTNTTIVYFSPAIGAKNVSDDEGSSETVSRLKYLVNEIRSQTDNNIFFDQFNFYDNTRSFSHNTKVKESDVDQFLNTSLTFLKDSGISYGFWTYKDYKENHLYNPNFVEHFKGWKISNVDFGRSKAVIYPNGYVTQLTEYPGTEVCINGYSKNETILTINDIDVVVRNKQPTTTCLSFSMPQNHISIKNSGYENFFLAETSLFSHIQKGLLIDIDDNSSEYLKIIRSSNFH